MIQRKYRVVFRSIVTIVVEAENQEQAAEKAQRQWGVDPMSYLDSTQNTITVDEAKLN